MRSSRDIEDAFTYHSPKVDEVELMGELRGEFKRLAFRIFDELPESPERTIALRKLHEVSMLTNAAIVIHHLRP